MKIRQADIKDLGAVRLAQLVAETKHAGQTDKAGKAYIGHPRTVASLVETDDEKTVAWLHDTVEDTDVTLDLLRRLGFSETVVAAVDAVTRRPGEDRQAYLERVKADPIARKVKLADLTHNADLSRFDGVRPLTQKDLDRKEQYLREMAYLQA